ncbi:MAG TPA: efflux RND transporter periplasmic adaptor subunit [Candidatus Polarisedimenticolia bacterium]|jgi:HlyD family secretion protein
MKPRLFPLWALVLIGLAACEGRAGRDPVYSGTVEAVEVNVAPEVSGKLLSRPVDQGDTVEPGTPVATIDPEPYRLALAETEAARDEASARLALLTAGYRSEEVEAAAREMDEAGAQLTQAEARIGRIEDLVAKQIATPDDLDLARRDRDAARARLAGAKQRHALLARGYRREEIAAARAEVARLEALRDQRALDLTRTTVRSPLAGTVTEKLMEVGEYARPGSPIVAVADLTNLYTWVYLSEVELGGVRLGEEVAVRIDSYPGRDFRGVVVYISTQAQFTPKNVQTVEDRVQLVFGVKVAVKSPAGELKVGIPADVVLARRPSSP